jgi:galactokinase
VVWSREIGAWADFRIGDERRRGGWLDYVMGCTAMLREAGHVLGGAELRISSEVPTGSGLSSSAALEVSVLRALREAFSLPIDDLALALLAHRPEADFVGAPVGTMDQLVASLGKPGCALFIDTRTLEMRSITLPDADLVVISSGLRHDHAVGDYRTRRTECEQAAKLLGVVSLRDVPETFLPHVAALPAPWNRRARHVITENARVLAAVAAIDSGDLRRLGALFVASHESMRDDFEVSLPAIDALVAIAVADPDVHGARLTGGGFGGSIVALAARGAGPAAAKRISGRYLVQTGNVPQTLVAGERPR